MKLAFLIIAVIGGGSLVLDLQDGEGAPPIGVSAIVLLLTFGLGLMVRASSGTSTWSERELWRANPFRYFVNPLNREAYFYPPLFHLGAITCSAGGASAVVVSAFTSQEMIGHGAVLLAMGMGSCLGIRWWDVMRMKRSVQRRPQPTSEP
jgi:hypothetical protein